MAPKMTCIATSVLYKGNEIGVKLKYDAEYFHKWFSWVTPLARAKPGTAKFLRAKILQIKAAISRTLQGRDGEWQETDVTDFGLLFHEFHDLAKGQKAVVQSLERMPELEWDGAWWQC